MRYAQRILTPDMTVDDSKDFPLAMQRIADLTVSFLGGKNAVMPFGLKLRKGGKQPNQIKDVEAPLRRR